MCNEVEGSATITSQLGCSPGNASAETELEAVPVQLSADVPACVVDKQDLSFALCLGHCIGHLIQEELEYVAIHSVHDQYKELTTLGATAQITFWRMWSPR